MSDYNLPKKDIKQFKNLILNSKNISYYEYYDGITITNELEKVLIPADGGGLVFYTNLLFELLPESNLEELEYRSRFGSEISYENFKGIPKTLKKLSSQNFLNLDILKFKDELDKIKLIDFDAEEIAEDLEIDWENGELGEIPLYKTDLDLYYILGSKLHKVKEGDMHEYYDLKPQIYLK